MPDTKIGYIRIAVFNENTGDDFAKKYAELEKQGMQALVLDLRSNPGGVFDAGVAVAGMLVPKGPIVSVVDKNGNKYEETSSLEKVKYPLAVLVDHGSASATENVDVFIKDTKSGKRYIGFQIRDELFLLIIADFLCLFSIYSGKDNIFQR